MNIASKTLWLRFLMWPFLVVGFLAVMEFGQLSLLSFLTKVSAALVGYGVGSVVPYILSDDFHYKRIASSEERDGQKVVKFVRMTEKDFESAKTNVQMIFALGLVCWVANQFLPTRPMFSQYPPLSRWFWLSGPIYCLIAGVLYVSMRRYPGELESKKRPVQIGEGKGNGIIISEATSRQTQTELTEGEN